MFLDEAARMATRSLWSNKGRSSLTILGVVIGITVVVALTSMGASFEGSITGQFDDVDDRSIFVTAGADGPQGGPPDAGQFGLVFTETDRDFLLGIPDVDQVLVQGSVAVTGLTYAGKDQVFESLTALTSEAEEVRDLEAYLDGEPFADGEEEVVLGYTIARLLAGLDAAGNLKIAAGDTITVALTNGESLDVTVAGILAESDSVFGTNNGQVFVPVDPFYTIMRNSPSTGDMVRVFDGFTVVASPGAKVNDVRDDVESYMLDASDASRLLEDVDGVTIFVATASDIQDQISALFDQITLFVAGLAGVSLVVGGIMIGTIMLISVSERTKEIGVMKAIGGLDRDILAMFVVEASIIGLIGAIIGTGLGALSGFILIESLFGDDVSFKLDTGGLVTGIVVGTSIGIVAGLLPATRATKIQPVEALSYE